MKIVHLLLTGLFFTLDYGYAQQPVDEINNEKPSKVICITMPKGGTHMLLKCISLFDIPSLQYGYAVNKYNKPQRKDSSEPSEYIVKYKKKSSFYPPHHYKGNLDTSLVGVLPTYITNTLKNRLNNLHIFHWPYTAEAASFFYQKAKAAFFLIRDPRAMLVSLAFMIKDGRLEGEHANVNDIIWDLIDGRQQHFVRWGVAIHDAYPLIWQLGVTDFYKLYLPWMQAKGFYTVRFEDLVGSKGGGSDELQLQVIKNIADHLGVTSSQEKIMAVRDKLYGGSSTFREGKIDGWKKYFTAEMKAAYKAVPGANQLLIDLGYEKDDQW